MVDCIPTGYKALANRFHLYPVKFLKQNKMFGIFMLLGRYFFWPVFFSWLWLFFVVGLKRG